MRAAGTSTWPAWPQWPMCRKSGCGGGTSDRRRAQPSGSLSHSPVDPVAAPAATWSDIGPRRRSDAGHLHAPAFCEVPFGIEGDQKDLLNAVDAEAQILGDEEDAMIETAVEAGEELDPETSWSEDEPQEELVVTEEDDDATDPEQHDD